MSTIHRFKITRPNLSTPFYFEGSPIEELSFANDSSILAQYVGLNFEESTLSTPGKEHIPKYEEVITWNELWERRNELQPKDKALAEASWNDGDNGFTEKSQYAGFNYLSLTYTQILVFDTLENLMTTYNSLMTNDKVEESVSQCIATNNGITEEVFVDGNLYSAFPSKFAGRF